MATQLTVAIDTDFWSKHLEHRPRKIAPEIITQNNFQSHIDVPEALDQE
jgi:hypothetical protein